MHLFNTLKANYYNPDGTPATPTLTADQLYTTALSANNNFAENQLIYDEFNYYQDTKKVLGVHPVFRVLKLTEKVKSMREASAVKRHMLLTNYIYRDTKKLKSITDKDKREAFENKLKLKQEERELIAKIHKLDE
ncbi:hypothetical protein ACFFVB_18415 [Formosa undariae]|uniref:Uncharacterized protein n=1 Tax=Formosa undariae TaxID=1325436 RepID=A0ABV5F6I2_9FLAO